MHACIKEIDGPDQGEEHDGDSDENSEPYIRYSDFNEIIQKILSCPINASPQEVYGYDPDPEFSHTLPPVLARGCEDIIYPEAGFQVGEGCLSAEDADRTDGTVGWNTKDATRWSRSKPAGT